MCTHTGSGIAIGNWHIDIRIRIRIQAVQGTNPARRGIIFHIHAATIFLISDVFWRDPAEIRRLKLLSKIETNGNAPKNEVEDEKNVEKHGQIQKLKLTTRTHICTN